MRSTTISNIRRTRICTTGRPAAPGADRTQPHSRCASSVACSRSMWKSWRRSASGTATQMAGRPGRTAGRPGGPCQAGWDSEAARILDWSKLLPTWPAYRRVKGIRARLYYDAGSTLSSRWARWKTRGAAANGRRFCAADRVEGIAPLPGRGEVTVGHARKLPKVVE